MRARELMSTPVVTVYPETPLKNVAETMAAHQVSGVPVVDHYGAPDDGARHQPPSDR